LTGNDESSLDDAGKNQHSHSLVGQSFGAWGVFVKFIQGRFSVAIDGARARRQRKGRNKDNETDHDY
jgi:hypothetical protein